ncbi:MAG: SDR family oxidoreductase [Piscinibacter sp.]|uniref:SDR family oxidoreductase n=1 Tax=Piscinibacter sp. TaxID=1903157 RepID=UPI0011D34D0B|nr:MAG: SDR family oxidoreductase [Burkholderiaceae bacterium]HPM65950.1 SDR family oxidoreductase [Piscinibacter sp.]
MATAIEIARADLAARPRRWALTGVAGFIGSHLLEALLSLDQDVVGLDNFATGSRRNLELVRDHVGESRWKRFRMIEGDIRDLAECRAVCQGAHSVLHQAALGSVPRSIADPIASHMTNVDGFLNMLVAARDARIERFVYAASSAAYGDHPGLPKVEQSIGQPLSPYAATKVFNEIYAQVFARQWALSCVGLRYFNVFGPRQDPHGAYAAVIPRWIAQMLDGQAVQVNGDGQTSRDFSYVANAVQANLLAATADRVVVTGEIYNVACGERTTLLELHRHIAARLGERSWPEATLLPRHENERAGDVRHSLADIGKAARHLGYAPTHDVRSGLAETVDWYIAQVGAAATV